MRLKRDKIAWLQDELDCRNRALATEHVIEMGLRQQLENVLSVKKKIENELAELRYENAVLTYPGRQQAWRNLKRLVLDWLEE